MCEQVTATGPKAAGLHGEIQSYTSFWGIEMGSHISCHKWQGLLDLELNNPQG